MKEQFDRRQRSRLVTAGNVETETSRRNVDHLVIVKGAGHDFANGHPFGIELLLQMRDKRRLARTHLSGDDDETLTLIEAVAEIAQRFLVRETLEIESRIGRELEGALAETVELFVHGALSYQKS